MKPDTEEIDKNPEGELYGRIFGILPDRDKLTSLDASLTSLGTVVIEVLDGPAGIAKLEEWKEEVAQYFFGDMEGEMLQRYSDAAKNRLIVFSIVVDSGEATGIGEIAKANGASEVTHFGNSAITSY